MWYRCRLTVVIKRPSLRLSGKNSLENFFEKVSFLKKNHSESKFLHIKWVRTEWGRFSISWFILILKGRTRGTTECNSSKNCHLTKDRRITFRLGEGFSKWKISHDPQSIAFEVSVGWRTRTGQSQTKYDKNALFLVGSDYCQEKAFRAVCCTFWNAQIQQPFSQCLYRWIRRRNSTWGLGKLLSQKIINQAAFLRAEQFTISGDKSGSNQ